MPTVCYHLHICSSANNMDSDLMQNSSFIDNNTMSTLLENVTLSQPVLPDVPIHQAYETSYTGVYIFLLVFFLFISAYAIGQWNIVTFVWFIVVTGLWIPILMYYSVRIAVDMFKNSTCYSTCININNSKTENNTQTQIEMETIDTV